MCCPIYDMVCSTTFHLAAQQEALHASLVGVAERKALGIGTLEQPRVSIFTYPLVSVSPPFPFEAGPPIEHHHASGKARTSMTVTPHVRSANNLSYTRTLSLLRRELGPHFPLEKLWERHTYFVSCSGSGSCRVRFGSPAISTRERFCEEYSGH